MNMEAGTKTGTKAGAKPETEAMTENNIRSDSRNNTETVIGSNTETISGSNTETVSGSNTETISGSYAKTDIKSYLSQAKYLDMRIKSELQQVDALHALATSCSAVITGMPRNSGSAASRMENAVCKMADLENEIGRAVVELIDLKKEIGGVIRTTGNPEYQTLLEKRYLCYLSWEKIASDMGYDLRYIYKLHNRALEKCRLPDYCYQRAEYSQPCAGEMQTPEENGKCRVPEKIPKFRKKAQKGTE